MDVLWGRGRRTTGTAQRQAGECQQRLAKEAYSLTEELSQDQSNCASRRWGQSDPQMVPKHCPTWGLGPGNRKKQTKSFLP